MLPSAKGLFLSAVHAVLGLSVIVLNLAAGAWGAVAWTRREPSVVFWHLLRAAQVAVVVEVVLGLLLLASGQRAEDGLHLLYGLAPLVVTLVSEGMRVGAAQRELDDIDDVDALSRDEQRTIARRVVRQETGIMALGALLIVTLSLRAYVSGA